jgi:hypothetical protein
MIKTVIAENFKTLDSMMLTMQERPLNRAFAKEIEVSSQRDETYKKEAGRAAWSGSYTYDEAKEVLQDGYFEPLEKMKTAIMKIGQAEQFQRPRTKNDFVGYVPNVPNTLMNLPITMINRERIAPKTKTIHLTYSFCAAAKTTTNDLIKGGINFISLVNSLEKQGYRVKIDIVFATKEKSTVAAMTVNLKEYGQQTNLLKLAFPLVHPAMLRRFAFKWLETTPELKEQAFVFGYGMALNFVFGDNLKKERDFLKEHGIISGENSYYCNVYTAMKAKNLEELADKMEIVRK